MAVKKTTFELLPLETIIEVVAIDREGGAMKKEMKYGDWLEIKKKKGFIYKAYQKGFSQFN
jgi:hypothetical protein